MKAITYNRYERAGIIFLVLLSILAQVIPSLLPRKNLSLVPSELLVQLTDSIKVKEVNSFNTITTPVKAEYFFFDPNAISKGGWIKLGVREKIAGNIIKYREKGGKFREANDLDKIWGIKKEELDILKKYVRLEKQENKESEEREFAKSRTQEPVKKVEINSADSSALEALPGIGAKLASRIVNYRKRLGGFHDLAQLKEVYGLKDSLLQKALPFLYITPAITMVNLNKATENDLRSHPYLRSVAKILVAYRNQHGDFSSVKDLRHIMVMNDSIIERITPYITVH